MTPTIAARSLLVMGCPWIAWPFPSERDAPASPLPPSQAKVKNAGEQNRG